MIWYNYWVEAHKLRVGMIVIHGGREHIVHSHYEGTCGRRIVQVADIRRPQSGEGIVCNNVPVDQLSEKATK